MDDLELLRTYARTRSADAFGRLVQRYVNLVYSTALRRVHDRHLAEDVTQSVFMLLAVRADTIKTGTILSGWLYQTAKNYSRDVMRKQERQVRREQAAARADVASAPESQWEQVSPLLEEAIDRLGSKERDAVLLRFFNGLSVSETATALQIDANAASKRIARGVEKIRTFLQSRGVTTASSSALSIIMAERAVEQAPQALVATAELVGGSVTPIVAAAGKISLAKAIAAVVVVVASGGAIFGVVKTIRPAASATRQVVIASASAPARATRPAGPLRPVSAEQAERIRAAIEELRNYQPTAENDSWSAAIRELVTIGRPAVPALVAELEQTDRDMTIRALGFTLRAIGDPRAGPALMRAIPRTRVISSDYGLRFADAEIERFMRSHEISGDPDSMTYGRAIRELDAAMTKITGHVAGRAWAIDARRDTESDRAAAQKRHEEFAKKWETWWAQHQDELVTTEEMASLSPTSATTRASR